MADDDTPRLSIETLKALQEFLHEQTFSEKTTVTENWQLSQFWYDDHTASTLSSAILSLCNDNSSIGLISCPTLYPNVRSEIEKASKSIRAVLFEYDKRFSKYESDYTFYDYNNPLDLDEKFQKFFDVVVADPPFLSNECLTKTVQTINLIKKPNGKIIICTGAVMEDLAVELMNVKKVEFQPKHRNNLANEFICLTNFGELTNSPIV